MELRAFALKLLREQGLWQPLFNVLRSCGSKTRGSFSCSTSSDWDRWSYASAADRWAGSVWHGTVGQADRKVLNLDWQTVGAVPRIVTFKRGEWEQWLLMS